MVIFLAVLLLIICIGTSFSGRNKFFPDYVSHESTSNVNGIFSVLIFLSHAAEYMELSGALDAPYLKLKALTGQIVVVTYLFFSGFGIMESIKKKGLLYVKTMPVKRLFKTWYHFALAVILYIGTNLLIENELKPKSTLLAFTGYKSIGNSNWYMFVTFVLYIIVIISFLVFKKSRKLALALTFVLSIAFLYAEMKVGLPERFYNTAMCFPLGMLFSEFKDKIDGFLMKNDGRWFAAVCAIIIAAGLAYISPYRAESALCHAVLAILFVLLVTVALMKVKIKSPVLKWFGSHVFGFFILQRIPMMILNHFVPDCNSYLFVGISFVLTIAATLAFDFVTGKLDKLLLKSKK